jgi:hypothetical protein
MKMDDMDFDFIPVPLVASEAPDFTATAVMPDNSFNKEFKLADYRGQVRRDVLLPAGLHLRVPVRDHRLRQGTR